MSAKNSHCMSRPFLLLAGALLVGVLPLNAQELWREGRNISGLAFYEDNHKEASLGGSFTSGGFRLPSEASTLWQAGVQASAESHYKDLLFVGAFSFDVQHGREMMGSMFTNPGYYPIDVLEFTPGPKTRQTYGVGGGLAWINRSRWIPGFTLQFQGVNYSKRKDLRHTTYRQEINFAPCILYKGDRWRIGATLILDKNSEFIQAEQIGSATAETYYAFLDKGKRYGIMEAWDGSGIHLADPGLDRMAVSRTSLGFAAQVSLEERLYADMQYSFSRGQVGEKGYTWFRFPGQGIQAKVLWNIPGKRGRHTLRADMDWEGVDNFESVIDRVTAGGVTTPVEYGSNRIYEKRNISFGPSYAYESSAGWGLKASPMLAMERDRGTYMYPYLNYDYSLMLNLLLEGHVTLGPVTLTASLEFRSELDEDHEVIHTNEEEEGVVSFPVRLQDWWDMEEEHNDVTLLGGSLDVRYHFTLAKRHRFFVEAGCSAFHGFHVFLLPGSNRQTTHLSIGYHF